MKSLYFIFGTLIISITTFQYSLASKAHQNSNFIKDSCTTTTYPQICYSTLSIYAAQIKSSPKLLATKALDVAHNAAQSASKTMAQLSRIQGLRPKVSAALSDCTVAVDNSMAQLQRAIEKMRDKSAQNEASTMMVNDVQTWTSTALTYTGTCMDGFGGRETDGNVKIIVRKKIMRLSQVTSNALALVNSYASRRKDNHRNP